jgi:hypothetical protein
VLHVTTSHYANFYYVLLHHVWRYYYIVALLQLPDYHAAKDIVGTLTALNYREQIVRETADAVRLRTACMIAL